MDDVFVGETFQLITMLTIYSLPVASIILINDQFGHVIGQVRNRSATIYRSAIPMILISMVKVPKKAKSNFAIHIYAINPYHGISDLQQAPTRIKT